MASLLTDPLLEVCAQGSAPNKNFYYLTITKSEVIWRWWTISLRSYERNARPGEKKLSHQNMLEDTKLQGEISSAFGRDVLEHARLLCQGHFNYLERLPDTLLLHIMGFLRLEDVGQLLRTSRHFWKLCQSEVYWENTVRRHCCTLSDDVVSLAYKIGWRRVFFTNKIKLQLLNNRNVKKPLKAVEDTSDNQNDTPVRSPVDRNPDCFGEEPIITRGDSPILSMLTDRYLSPTSALTSSSGEDSGSLETQKSLDDMQTLQVAQNSADLNPDNRLSSSSPPLDLSSCSEDAWVIQEVKDDLKKLRLAQTSSTLSIGFDDNLLSTSSTSTSALFSSSDEDSCPSVMKEYMEKLRKFQLAQNSADVISDDNLSSSPPFDLSSCFEEDWPIKEVKEDLKKWRLVQTSSSSISALSSSSEEDSGSSVTKEFTEKAQDSSSKSINQGVI